MKKHLILCFLLILGLKSYGQSTYVVALDTRAVNDSVNYFKKKLSFDFKTRVAVGVPGLGTYSGMLTLAPWFDNSGGRVHQLNFNDGGVYYRSGSFLAPQWDSWKKLVIEDANGNVSIGTTDPKGYKLAVAGNMIAESVKVKLQGTWPDYVFTKDFELASLKETERYIKDKGHLPDIPSAAEVKSNGIDLGEMNAKLLKKIEELTLVMIELNKKVEQQSETLGKQQKQLDKLK